MLKIFPSPRLPLFPKKKKRFRPLRPKAFCLSKDPCQKMPPHCPSAASSARIRSSLLRTRLARLLAYCG